VLVAASAAPGAPAGVPPDQTLVTLLTGATGFLGNHLARLLLEEGRDLRLLVRETSDRRPLAALPRINGSTVNGSTVLGDLQDRDSLDRAVEGCDQLFHVAADYRLWSRDPGELRRSNVDGTRNMLEAAAQAGVKRIVYTSTVGTLSLPGDESTPAGPQDLTGPYKKTKFEAEQIALDFARGGAPVVIVNPTAPVGERDFKPTPTGKIIQDFLDDRMPAYLDTGLNLVDVRDVARGHLLAAQKGRPGERYLLGARNMTLQEILETLSEITGKPAPKLKIPYAAAYAFSLLETGLAAVTGREPRAPLEAVRMARKKMYVHSDKAERELGYQPGPVEPALARAVEWFQNPSY